MSGVLERYRSFIPEWEAFRAAATRPEPTVVRVRRARITPEELVGRLKRQGFELSPVEGLPGFFRAEREPAPLARTLEHWQGLFYIQQASAGVAVPILDPLPGEQVLDLCAAPGGKTSQIAEAMADRGAVIAVEENERRLQALVGNMSRLLHPSVMLVRGDGRRAEGRERFDRVLVDVPCSGEGRMRRGRSEGAVPSERARAALVSRQIELLRRGVAHVRAGGRVLYVTCTLAPEENEGVVDRILSEGGVRLVPLRPDLPHLPGLAGFEGTRYAPELEGTCRILPHHLDSGGLFMALLERVGERDPGRHWDAVPEADRESVRTGLSVLALEGSAAGRAGADVAWTRQGDSLRFHRLSGRPATLLERSEGWRTVATGIRGLAPGRSGHLRPTTDLLRWLEGAPGPRTLELGVEEWRSLLAGRDVRRPSASAGFAALHLEGAALCRGRVRSGRVFHDLAPPRARWLEGVLAQRG